MKITKGLQKSFEMHAKKHVHPVINNAVLRGGIREASIDHSVITSMQYTFSEEISTGRITDQKMSGRCWLFAGLNFMREKVAKKYKIKDIELSQAYQQFWDKLEKANYFLANIIETSDEPLDGRLVSYLLMAPIQDGGQWDMFANLVEKYGVVPKSAMPETHHSSNTRFMDEILTAKLREYALKIRKAKGKKAMGTTKEKCMKEYYSLLVTFLGHPPATFDFEYRDDKDKFHADRKLSPKKFFAKYVHINLDDYVSVVNAPTKDKPFNTMLSVNFLNNVIEGRRVKYLNVKNDVMKKLALKQLQAKETVWFGCDVGKMLDSPSGIMHSSLYNYAGALGTTFSLSKGDRLNVGESQLTHAMLFTGVNVVKGKPNRWKVENSWGAKRSADTPLGKDGIFIMEDAWFDLFNYQVVIHKKHLSAELKKVLKQEALEYPPWDPLGALARMQ